MSAFAKEKYFSQSGVAQKTSWPARQRWRTQVHESELEM
jgi:hypothetical protein